MSHPSATGTPCFREEGGIQRAVPPEKRAPSGHDDDAKSAWTGSRMKGLGITDVSCVWPFFLQDSEDSRDRHETFSETMRCSSSLFANYDTDFR